MITSTHTHSAGSHLLVLGQLHLHLLRNLGELLLAVTAPKEVLCAQRGRAQRRLDGAAGTRGGSARRQERPGEAQQAGRPPALGAQQPRPAPSPSSTS